MKLKTKKNISYVTLYLFVSPSLSPFFLFYKFQATQYSHTQTYRERERECTVTTLHSYNTFSHSKTHQLL